MVDQIVNTCGKTVSINLHRRKLCAQGRQAFAEALTQMLKSSGVEMRRRPRHRCAANPERDGRRPKIEQRQHDLQHGLKARAVVGQWRLGDNFAIFEGHRRGGVGPQAKTIPRPRDRQPACPFWNEIQRQSVGPAPSGASAETT